MEITATALSRQGSHLISVSTNGVTKADAPGSNVNRGELLYQVLATCHYNDIYREAGRL